MIIRYGLLLILSKQQEQHNDAAHIIPIMWIVLEVEEENKETDNMSGKLLAKSNRFKVKNREVKLTVV